MAAKRAEESDPLHELGWSMVRPADAPADTAELDAGAEVVLHLSDLLRDAKGEIVVYNDSGFRTLAIATEAKVVASGQSGRHVTAVGADVSGFRYITFDDGTTLYYPEGVELVTRRRPA
jgi:hypothetical protein